MNFSGKEPGQDKDYSVDDYANCDSLQVTSSSNQLPALALNLYDFKNRHPCRTFILADGVTGILAKQSSLLTHH